MEDRAKISEYQEHKDITTNSTIDVASAKQAQQNTETKEKSYRGGQEEFAEMRQIYGDDVTTEPNDTQITACVEGAAVDAVSMDSSNVPNNVMSDADSQPTSNDKEDFMEMQISDIRSCPADNQEKGAAVTDTEKEDSGNVEVKQVNGGEIECSEKSGIENGESGMLDDNVMENEAHSDVGVSNNDLGAVDTENNSKVGDNSEMKDEEVSAGGDMDIGQGENADVEMVEERLGNGGDNELGDNGGTAGSGKVEGETADSETTPKDNSAIEDISGAKQSPNDDNQNIELSAVGEPDLNIKNCLSVDDKVSNDDTTLKSDEVRTENSPTEIEEPTSPSAPTDKEIVPVLSPSSDRVYPHEAGMLADEDDLLILIKDTEVPNDDTDPLRAMKTVPDSLMINDSSRMGGYGVFCSEFLPEGVSFGPYEGEIVQEAIDTKYCWKIYMEGQLKHCLDSRDEAKSNWMRYVQFTNSLDHNLEARQYQGHIYYRTTSNIYPGTELLLQTNMSVRGEKDAVRKDRSSGKRRGRPGRKTKMGFPSATAKELDFGNDVVLLEGPNYECVTCKLCFPVYADLQEHMLQHSKSRSPRAAEIEYDGSPPEDHMLYEEGSSKPHVCKHCAKAFPSPSLLVTHVRIHTGEKPYSCKTCGRGFNQAGNMRQHMKTHHGKLKFFKCDTCTADYSSLRELKQHIRELHETRNYICGICGKGFKEATHLKMHEKVHESAMDKLLCPICKLQFPSREVLLDHMHVHT